jgi:hypothetical protein
MKSPMIIALAIVLVSPVLTENLICAGVRGEIR